VPAQAHWQVDPAVNTDTPAATTLVEPGCHGPVGTGTQGIGVRTPIAAAVAALTAGFAGEMHTPNVGRFAMGIVSMIFATSCPPAVTKGPVGITVSGAGAAPIVHDSKAELTTSGGIALHSPAASSVGASDLPLARTPESRTAEPARTGGWDGPIGPLIAPLEAGRTFAG
jgi:hypothetical protein